MSHSTTTDGCGLYPPSYYASSVRHLPVFPAAAGEIRCDICVVGGGLTGLSAALHLSRRGYDVVLLEAERVGFGASGRNGGQVGNGQRLNQSSIERMVGREDARILWKIANQSVELVKVIASSDKVEAEYHAGLVHAAHRRRMVREFHDHANKLRNDYGYQQIRCVDREEMRHLVDSPVYLGGSVDKGSGHINPLALVFGIARMAKNAGARIFELSRVEKLNTDSPARVFTETAQVRAEHVLLACNGYLGGLDRYVAERVMPINNFIIASEPISPERRNSIIRNNFAVADSKFVVNYFRFSDDGRLLFGGGESYGHRFPKDIEAFVRKPLSTVFPQLGELKIDYAWGGTLAITMNRMPHFERIGGNLLSFSGYSGHGVAMATLAGQIAAEAVAGQSERFDAMASVPSRRFPGGTRFRFPLLVLAMLWYSLRDRL